MSKLMQKLSQIFEKYLFFGVVGLSLFILLYPKFPLLNVPGTYVAIRLEDFLIASLVGWWLVANLFKLKNLLSELVTQAVLIFWAIGILSLFSGIFLTQTVIPHLGFLHYLRRIEMMMLFFIAFYTFSNLRQIKIWLSVMLAATFLMVLYGFGQQWFSFPVISTTNREFSKGLILFLTPDARVNSTFAGHYDLAAYLAIFLTVASSLVLFLRNIKNKLAIVFVAVLSFILLAMTAARVSFLAALAGVLGVFFLAGQKRLILGLVGIAILAFVISPELRHRTVATLTVNLLGGGGVKYQPPPSSATGSGAFLMDNVASSSASHSGLARDIAPGEPINSTELGVYRSFGIRLNDEWPRAIRALAKNPFLGTGYSSLTIATDNDYLRALGETGLLGFLSLSLVFWIIFKKMWEFQKRASSFPRYMIIGVFSASLAMFLNASVIDILESSKVASVWWFLLGVGFALMKMENRHE